jgi:crotonobetainyl-CoA:carnitine CoA-transferase CaiB-like acyl-CoA transferase
MSHGPLAGRRVLELGTMLAAPFASHILSQLGAEVIKIEPPAGDPTRSLVRGGPSGTFIAYSHDKQSLALDLGLPEGADAFRKLLATADIVVHNLAPRSARRLGVTYEDCIKVQPRLVYCHIRGYAKGPLADELASNPVAEASTGVMEANRINGRPSRLGPSYHDQFAGAYAVIGILAALTRTQASRQTHCIEVGLYETGLHVAARDLVGVQLKTQLLGKPEREPNGEFSMPGYGAYQTSDGRWLYLLMLNDGHWLKFCQALGLPQATDASLDRLRDRKKNREKVEEIVRQAVGGLTFAQARSCFGAVGFGYTEVVPLEEVLDAPQARQPGKLRQVSFRGLAFDVPAFPGVAASAEPSGASPPRELGEDSWAVLRSAGLSEQECHAMVQSGAMQGPDASTFTWAPAKPAP